jgi:G3E family GTPase
VGQVDDHRVIDNRKNTMPANLTDQIRSFVYRARRPFDPDAFHRFIHSQWPGVIRAKGHFWLATRPE